MLKIQNESSSRILILRFTEVGLARFVRIPVDRLNEKVLSASEVFGSDIESLSTELTENTSPEFLTARIEQYLLNHFQSPDWVDLYLETGATCLLSGEGSVYWTLLDTTGLGTRQKERRFRRITGINSHLLKRLKRFEHLFRLISGKTEREIRLTDFAYEIGYYDQSQFIREFRKSFGKSPGQFLKNSGPCQIIPVF
jgi:AraC-like DNA-binding protein